MEKRFNMKERREALGFTQKDVAKACGVSEGTVSRWESGNISNMKRDKIAKLAKIMQVKPSDIIGETEAVPVVEKKKNESVLEKKYNALDPHGKKVVDFVLDEEYARCTGVQKAEEKKIIPLFDTSFAAGPTDSMNTSAFDDYEVDVKSKAEFAIRISGDSMEPELHDGQIALCLKRPPEIGEIIVCMVNGAFVVKQFITDGYNIYLRSVNRKRKDKDIDILGTGQYQFACYGTVIHKRIPLVQQ